MRIALVLAGLAALAACQTASYYGNTSSPYFAVPDGSRLTLNKEVKFGPDQFSVHIQSGNILPMSQVQVYTPFCKFEINRRHNDTVTIAPDEIVITRAMQQQWDGTYSRFEPRPKLQVAALGQLAQMGDSGGTGGPPLYTFLTRMDLRSEKQPEIYRLTCARWAYPSMDGQVSIAEIRRALGPLFTLRLPGES